MTFNDILNTVIASIDADQVLLNGLLGQTYAGTLVSDNPTLYQAPEVDEVTGVWTLAQDTANDGSDFVGVYKLPSAAVESCVQSVTVVSHSNPASPKKPARYLPKDADPVTGWLDLTTVSALYDKKFNKLEIRSVSAFEVEVRVADCEWCYEFNFAQSNGGFTAVSLNCLASFGADWQAGADTGCSVANGVSYIAAITKTFTQTLIESITLRTKATGRSNGTHTTTIALGGVNSDVHAVSGNPANGVVQEYTYNVNALKSQIWLRAKNDAASGAVQPTGTAHIVSVTIRGNGANPFGPDNC